MKAPATPAKTPSKSPAKAAAVRGGKRADRRVPLAEMRRLMAVYGSLKCLRRRRASPGSPGSPAAADAAVIPLKPDSLKRKFYRWFPDLSERFSRDHTGFYTPKFGHEAEIRYRAEKRAQDGEALAKKRTRCRKRRQEGAEARKAKVEADDVASTALTSIDPARVSRTVSSDESSYSFVSHDEDGAAKLENGVDLELERTDSSIITEDAEPLDRSFLAEPCLFDDVEESFFGPPIVSPDGCGVSASSWESDASSIDEMLDRSLEECCEEILGSDDDASVSGYLLDMISS